MLTISTQIPTIARGQVRAIVKAHPAFKAYLTEHNIISADAHNSDLIEFALRHPSLKAQIEQMLAKPSAKASQKPEQLDIAPRELSEAVLEELRRSVKVRQLVEDIEQELRRVKTLATTAPKKSRKRKPTQCQSTAIA